MQKRLCFAAKPHNSDVLRHTVGMKKVCMLVAAALAVIAFAFVPAAPAGAMPFYGLDPKPLVLRAEFSTDYASSTPERKHNIALAAGALDNALIAPQSEFSFNARVGERSAARGYKEAKIIVGGKFTEGVGGGVCQVSTTLFNAVVLAGLRITESHPHSLQVGYVKPSTDAMVNYYFADLRFVNETKNPVYLKTSADGKKLTVRVYGEAMEEKVVLKSRIIGQTEPKENIVRDVSGEYPELRKGERMTLRYGKAGIKSESYVLRYAPDGRLLGRTRLRRDQYQPIDALIVEGTAELPEVGENGETPAEDDYAKENVNER